MIFYDQIYAGSRQLRRHPIGLFNDAISLVAQFFSRQVPLSAYRQRQVFGQPTDASQRLVQLVRYTG